MKDGWHNHKLEEICRLINGRAYKKNELLDTGKYPVLRVGNFFTTQKIYYSDLELEEDKYCSKGDLLYAWSASFGPRIWGGDKVIYHYHIWKVVPDVKQVDKNFLFYWFEWDKEKIKSEHGTGATMQHVTKGSMEARNICLPPLDEQKRIVAILDEAFEGIDAAKANAEKNVANAHELFENRLAALFAHPQKYWQTTTLGEVCDGVEYGTSSKSRKQGELAVLRMGNIQNGAIDWSDLVYSSDENEAVKYRLEKGDILFNRTNSAELVGKSAIYRGERPAIFAGYLIRVHYKRDIIDGEFLNYFLNSPAARNYGKTVMGKSVNQANISGSKLKDYPFAFPSKNEQKEIADGLRQLQEHSSNLASVYERKIQSFEELQQSFLHRAFAGELT